MIVTVTPGVLTLPPPHKPRSVGIHISAIIRCIALETGILKLNDAEELDLLEINPTTRFDDPMVCLRICMGLAWEEWYIPRLPEVMDHPDEMAMSEVYMSPDGLELTVFSTDRHDENRVVVHEVKLTYKSIKGIGMSNDELVQIKRVYPGVTKLNYSEIPALKDQWMWLAQLKSYCKGAFTRFARLHVLAVCGDYSYPIQPVLLIFDIEFSEQEIEDNWDLMITYKEVRTEIEMKQKGLT